MKLALTALLLAAACGTDDTSSAESLTRLPGECGTDETHVVGVFEPAENPEPGTGGTGTGGDDGNGTILIKVDRPGNHTIVVSSHETAKWKIVASNGARITNVYAVGKGKQTVSAPATANVMTESDAEGGAMACGYSWPGDSTCDTKGLLRLASIRLNKHPTSFHGCYAARNFTINEDMAVTSDCGGLARAGDAQDDIVTRCEPDEPESNCDDVVLY
jgi:hypothetical protein